MKQKRIFAAITAVLMSLSLGLSAFAETETAVAEDSVEGYYPKGQTQASGTDVNLETALTTVKRRITIPDYLTEFNYSSGTNRNNTSYTFNWSQKNGGTGIVPLKDSAGRSVRSINVTVVGGVITRYSRNFNLDGYKYDTDGAHIGALAVSQFEATAKKNIEQLNPGMSKSLRFTGNYANLYGTSVYFQFTRSENGVDVTANTGNMSFDKNTGDITSFSVTWWDDAVFKSPAGKISEEAMEKAYSSAIDLKKQYVIKRDYKTKTVSAAIIYQPETNYEFDAYTGKKSTIWDDYDKAMNTTGGPGVAESGEGIETDDAMMDSEEASAASNDVSFTEAELKAIAENDKMIKRDEASAIIKKDPYIGLTDEYQLTSGNLYTKNDFGVTNYWDLRYLINNTSKYASISVSLDADSGKVLSFSSYGYLKNQKNETAPKKLDVTKADKTAEEAFKYYMGDKNDEYGYNNEYDNTGYYTNPKTKDQYPTSKSYSKNRFHNGIIVRGENAYLSIDNDGKISSFRYTYTEVDFPSSDTLSQAKAYEKLWEQKDFELYYNGFVGLNGEASTYLLYQIDSFSLNAKTGELCDSYGDPLNDYSENEITFSDVKGTKYNTAVSALLAYGVYIEPVNGKFSANAVITQGQFNKLISNVYGGADLDEKSQGKTLTKADAAKIYVEATGGEKYAQLKGVFKAPYADVPENHAYVGYIAIAKAEGVFESGGNFNPGSSLTRGDAILMIYEMVK